MIPFLHLGPIPIPTFGLMVACSFLAAAYLLQADFDRRAPFLQSSAALKRGYRIHRDEGFLVIGIAGLAGIVGARLYHVLESPKEFFADPLPQLFSRYGFAWFGGFLGGFLALFFLARNAKMPLLEFLDICSPAAAVGYAIGRIGCLLSGDGDYGIPTKLPWGMSFPNGVVPTTGIWDSVGHSGVCSKFGLPENCTVHPTPLYEFFIWIAIAAFLWWLGSKTLNNPSPGGKIFAGYLILTGIARFLIEIIRLNDRSFFGMSNAQTASVVSVLLGLLVLFTTRPRPATA